ncbi:YezD family protein [Bacillus thuringiensis]|nr:YezD family protein [Bacillus thuringiensis]MEC3032030.1 YezD family protein [Bacillus thuringiensis]
MSVREHFDEVSEKIEAMLADMKYGSNTNVEQDGKGIHLEKTEKVRLK